MRAVRAVEASEQVGAFEREAREIVAHVMATRLWGRRKARRFVGRHLTRNTLDYWRVYGMFPVGFRNGSKPANARVRDDAGAWVKRAAAMSAGVR